MDNLGCNSDQSCHALKLLGGLQNLCDIDRIREGVALAGEAAKSKFSLLELKKS